MNYYEIPLSVLPEISAPGIETLSAKVKDILAKHGGSIIKSEYWGILELAYTIRKHKKARFYLLIVEGGPGLPADLTKYFKFNESMIRYPIYKLDKVWEGNSSMYSQILGKQKEGTNYPEEENAYRKIFAVAPIGAMKEAYEVESIDTTN